MKAKLLSEEDARAYLSLRVQAAKEERLPITAELRHELATFARDASGVISRHLSEGTQLWGLYDRLSLVGTVAVSRNFTVLASSHLWLWGLYVRGAYRGTPVSRALMEAALAWCENQPPDHRLFAAHHEANYRVRQFFERWHFRAPADGLESVGPSLPLSGYVLRERERARGTGTDA